MTVPFSQIDCPVTIIAPAAGWITKFIDKSREGLWVSATWTEKAKAYLKNGEYRYFSPVFHVRDSDNKVLRVLSVALTNTPRLNNLKPIAAKLDYLVISEDQRRINQMMGISSNEFMEYASEVNNSIRLFETVEEKINRLLPIN